MDSTRLKHLAGKAGKFADTTHDQRLRQQLRTIRTEFMEMAEQLRQVETLSSPASPLPR